MLYTYAVSLTVENVKVNIDEYSFSYNFSVNDNEAVAVIGASGCGKTTLLNVISGLIKPNEGRIILNDRDITSLPPYKRNIAYVFQDYALYEKLGPDERKGYATKPELVEKIEHPMTIDGQCKFMQDFMELIKSVDKATGFFYWEPAMIPVPGCGWATYEALNYTGEKGPLGNEWANQALFDYEGNALPALDVIKNF